ncbi:MAG TPA: GTPase HflX [Gemmatimonadales bacterium]|nr:GTPase HflX [Gemmatimonadales bacterium]
MEPPAERAILVAAPRKGSRDVEQLQEHLEELARLVDTAGAQVVGRLTQQVAAPSPATLLGEGKVGELKAKVAGEGATLAIFDDELTPVQGANLERELGVRVMDRAEVILDIFSTRARTAEAKLQVELAQLEYLLPRLTRMWTHLSRIRGGIGLRGPGETQLETDRRMIRRKILHHRAKLRDVARHRATLRNRAGRQKLLHAAIVGYTNAGKSSLLRALAGDRAGEIFVEDRLFATLDVLTREVDLGDGLRARVTDTVGFIRKLPHHLVASFRATLEEAREADVLLHVIDASHPEWEEQASVVNQVLGELEMADRPEVMVFNQMDQLTDPKAFRERILLLQPGAVFTSAVSSDGVEELKAALRDRVRSQRQTLRVVIPADDGARLAAVYRAGEVLDREETPEGVRLTVRMEEWRARQLSLGNGADRTRG